MLDEASFEPSAYGPVSRAAKRFQALRWFVRARYLAALGILTTFLVARYLVGMPLDPRPLMLTLAMLLPANLAFDVQQTRMLRQDTYCDPRRVTVLENCQMLVDLLCLAFLVHRYGGIENPFAILFFWHIAIGSTMDRPLPAFGKTSLILTLYLGVLWLEYAQVLPHYPLPGLFPWQLHRNRLWLISVSAAAAIGGYALYFLTAVVAEQLRQRGELLEAMAHELHAKNTELLRQREMREGFFRIVAHEIKRPVAAAIQMLDVIRQLHGEAMEPQAQNLLSRAKHRTASVLNLVKDLISFARLEDGGPEQEEYSQRRELLGSIPDLLEEHTPTAAAAGVKIVSEIGQDTNDAVVAVGADDFALVVHNLVSNAVRYSGRGGCVTVRARADNGGLSFSVEDQGIGISASDQQRLFKAFFRSRAAQRHSRDGSGLGLAIVKQVMDRASGSIQCDSEVGRGSTFTAVFPTVRKEVAEASALPTSPTDA